MTRKVGRPKAKPFTAEELRRLSAEIASDYIPAVERTRLELMPVDPWNVHAYWHLDPEELTQARSGMTSDARLILNFVDTTPRREGTDEASTTFDIEIDEATDNWYVNLWRGDKRYTAEIGLRDRDGRFVALARSSEVVTPRGEPAMVLDYRSVAVRKPSAAQAAHVVTKHTDNHALLKNLFPERRESEDTFPLVTPTSSRLSLAQSVPLPSTGHRSASDADFVPRYDEPPVPVRTANAISAHRFPVIDDEYIARYHAQAQSLINKTTQKEGGADVPLPPLPDTSKDSIAPAGELDSERPQPNATRDRSASPWSMPSDLRHPALGDSCAQAGFPTVGRAAAKPAPLPLESVLGSGVFSSAANSMHLDVSATLVITGQAPKDGAISWFGKSLSVDGNGRYEIRLVMETGPDLVALAKRLYERRIEE